MPEQTHTASFFAQVSRLFDGTQATPELEGAAADPATGGLQEAIRQRIKQSFNQQFDQFMGSSSRFARGSTDLFVDASIIAAQEINRRITPGALERILSRTARAAGDAFFDALADELKPSSADAKAPPDAPKQPL